MTARRSDAVTGIFVGQAALMSCAAFTEALARSSTAARFTSSAHSWHAAAAELASSWPRVIDSTTAALFCDAAVMAPEFSAFCTAIDRRFALRFWRFAFWFGPKLAFRFGPSVLARFALS